MKQIQNTFLKCICKNNSEHSNVLRVLWFHGAPCRKCSAGHGESPLSIYLSSYLPSVDSIQYEFVKTIIDSRFPNLHFLKSTTPMHKLSTVRTKNNFIFKSVLKR